jgi:hypothetical protein
MDEARRNHWEKAAYCEETDLPEEARYWEEVRERNWWGSPNHLSYDYIFNEAKVYIGFHNDYDDQNMRELLGDAYRAAPRYAVQKALEQCVFTTFDMNETKGQFLDKDKFPGKHIILISPEYLRSEGEDESHEDYTKRTTDGIKTALHELAHFYFRLINRQFNKAKNPLAEEDAADILTEEWFETWCQIKEIENQYWQEMMVANE